MICTKECVAGNCFVAFLMRTGIGSRLAIVEKRSCNSQIIKPQF